MEKKCEAHGLAAHFREDDLREALLSEEVLAEELRVGMAILRLLFVLGEGADQGDDRIHVRRPRIAKGELCFVHSDNDLTWGGCKTGRVPLDSPFYGLLTKRVGQARLSAALPHVPPGARVLDAGCGLTDLPDRIADYVGCDRNAEVLASQRERWPKKDFLEWDIGRGAAPPELEARAPFEGILLLAVLEHVADPAAVLSRAASLLAPSGRVIVTTPHPLGRLPLEAGAALGLLSSHARDEHETLLGRAALEEAGRSAGVSLVLYRRFLLGLNQLAVFSR
jgi:2-polyprenyl-3-methyl-5-hydroxy-6-metoxy-1,4-benzoquinol methylase